MINKIFYNHKLLTDIIVDPSDRRCKICIFEDGSKHARSELSNNLIKIQCLECGSLTNIKLYFNRTDKPYICKKCQSINHNPFKGKYHTEDFKRRMSESRRGKKLNPYNKSVYQWWNEKYDKHEAGKKIQDHKRKVSQATSGKRNPFFGKTHSKETIDRIKKKTEIARSLRTDDEKKYISNKLSNAQLRMLNENPIKYKKDRHEAAMASCRSRIRYKRSRPELLVEKYLKSQNIEFEYSVIFCDRQFDFGIGQKKYKILLEVQGDYWHGNPRKYTSLNHIQRRNVENDTIKLELANKYGFRVFYIWEDQINSGDFSVIQEIQDLIHEI